MTEQYGSVNCISEGKHLRTQNGSDDAFRLSTCDLDHGRPPDFIPEEDDEMKLRESVCIRIKGCVRVHIMEERVDIQGPKFESQVTSRRLSALHGVHDPDIHCG